MKFDFPFLTSLPTLFGFDSNGAAKRVDAATLFANTLGLKPGSTALVAFDGNSLTYGKTSSHPAANEDDFTGTGNYPALVKAALVAAFPSVTFTFKNFAVDGQQTSAMQADAKTQIDAIYNATAFDRHILIAWEVTNSIALYFNTGGQARQVFSQYCQDRRAAGWRVIALPVIPRTAGINSPLTQTQFNAEAAIFNTWLAKYWPTVADGYVNLNLLTITEPDNIHPVDAGYALIANAIVPEVSRLLRSGFNATSQAPINVPVSSTKLLLKGDGANNSTAITDSSENPKFIYPQGNAKISTTQSKFGGSSLSFDGTNSYLSIAPNPNWDFGTGDFTLEFWLYPNSLPAAGNFVGLVSRKAAAGNSTLAWTLNILPSGAGFALNILDSGGNYAGTNQVTSSFSIPINTWTHVALVSYQGIRKFYANGTLVGTATANPSMESNPVGNVGTLLVGVQDSFNFLNGYIDDLRISTYAVYTANFTPPGSLTT